MKNNENQIKGYGSESLPIISDKQEVQKNCMRLYVYLVSISRFEGKNKPRTFTNRDFNINQIKKALHMHPDTIKKYWVLLEDRGLLKYEGPAHAGVGFKELHSVRKQDGATYYSIPKKSPYRIIPRETIDKIQTEYLVTEQELKLYLMLAEIQERFTYMKPPERLVSVADLRELLQLKKEKKTDKAIISGLLWLKSLNLIEYKFTDDKTNLGENANIFILDNVFYYTDGGEVGKFLKGSDTSVLSEDIKEDILKSKGLEMF